MHVTTSCFTLLCSVGRPLRQGRNPKTSSRWSFGTQISPTWPKNHIFHRRVLEKSHFVPKACCTQPACVSPSCAPSAARRQRQDTPEIRPRNDHDLLGPKSPPKRVREPPRHNPESAKHYGDLPICKSVQNYLQCESSRRRNRFETKRPPKHQ